MSRTDVQDTVREMWETRPARSRADRQIAGVAAGIAHRYDIDPVLVRVGFVVAAFSGVGAALYIAGWILLPEEPAAPGTSAPSRAPRGVLLAGLAVAAAITVGSLFGGNGPDIFLPLLAVAGLLYLLHRSRGHRGTGAAATGAASVAPGAEPTTVTHPVTRTGTVSAAEGATAETVTTAQPGMAHPPQTPPAWDPLGAAPFAWDLPEPSAPPPVPPRHRPPVTPVTLGLTLLAGAVTAVVLLLTGSLSLATVPLLLGVTLAVLGAGLVVGAFLRTGRGLVPIALLLCALTWAVVAAPLDRWQGNGFGELSAAPTTVTEVQPTYRRTAGEINLDLSNLDLAVPPGGNADPVRSFISMGAGDVEVRVPPNADLTLTSTAGAGDMTFGDRSAGGLGSRLQVTDDLGADGVRSGQPLVLDVELGAGSLEVHRG